MQYRTLGSTDLKVSEISLGCQTLGGRNWWIHGEDCGWPDVDEQEAIEAVNYAVDQGVNHFDNADGYGRGRAERLLAKALDPRSKDVIIATKMGHYPGTAEHGYEALHIRHQCEQSLKNLRRDVIDIYYFHHGDFGPNDKYLDDALDMMQRLKDAGMIRHVGLSAYSHDDFVRLVPKIRPAVLQGGANAMREDFIREGSPTRKIMDEYKRSFVAFSPLAQGILLDKYNPNQPPTFEAGDNRLHSPRFQAPFLREIAPKLAKLKSRFGSSTKDLARMALQFLLHNPRIGCVIPGFRNKRQVEINISASGKPLTDEDIAFIREVFPSESSRT